MTERKQQGEPGQSGQRQTRTDQERGDRAMENRPRPIERDREMQEQDTGTGEDQNSLRREDRDLDL